MSCSLVFNDQPPGQAPVAQISNYDPDGPTVDATGSIGTKVRAKVVRDGIVLETTPGEANTGTNQIAVATSLANGDMLCVQATFNDFFYSDEDCLTIPTPEYGFVPVS